MHSLLLLRVSSLALALCSLAVASADKPTGKLDRSQRDTQATSHDQALTETLSAAHKLHRVEREVDEPDLVTLLEEAAKRGRSFHRFGKRGRSFHRFGRGYEDKMLDDFAEVDKRGRSFHRFGRAGEDEDLLSAIDEAVKRGRSFHRFGKRELGEELMFDNEEKR